MAREPDDHDPRDRRAVVARLRTGERVLGTFCSIDSPAAAEVVAATGFEVVLLDLEHGEFGPEALPGLLRAVEVGGGTGIVRVRTPDQLGPALDAGAAGVLVPDVRSAAAATAAVRATRYPPGGERGAAPMVRDVRYGVRSFEDHLERARPFVGVQIEGPDGIAAIDEVLGVDGLDLVFVGPFDLSQHLGVPGQVTDRRVVDAIAGIVRRAAARDIATGVWAPDAAAARIWLRAGVGLVAVGNVTALLAAATRQLVADLGELADAPSRPEDG